MTQHAFTIPLSDGSSFQFEIPTPKPTYQSTFTFAIHKSGSVLLSILEAMCDHASIPRVGLSKECFHRGININALDPRAIATLLGQSGYCFYGFRQIHGFFGSISLFGRRKLMLVRDPRDVLTSYYFSVRNSHPIPETGSSREVMLRQREFAAARDINQYVVSEAVAWIKNTYRSFIAIEDGNTKVYRYEDVIFNKRRWVRDIADWLRIGLDGDALDRIADTFDVVPDVENPNVHIRQVKPGNHKRHLSANTIKAIDRQYADVLRHYHYCGFFGWLYRKSGLNRLF